MIGKGLFISAVGAAFVFSALSLIVSDKYVLKTLNLFLILYLLTTVTFNGFRGFNDIDSDIESIISSSDKVYNNLINKIQDVNK